MCMVIYGKDIAKSSVELFCFILDCFSICLWERPKTHHVYDFGISVRVPAPPNHYDLFLETPGYFKSAKKIPNQFEKMRNLQMRAIQDFKMFGNGGRREIMKILLRNSWKSRIWDQDLPENMKWIVGNMGSLKLWNQEIKKPRNFETKKPRKQEPPTPQQKRLWCFRERIFAVVSEEDPLKGTDKGWTCHWFWKT